jgi:hypothetical protein
MRMNTEWHIAAQAHKHVSNIHLFKSNVTRLHTTAFNRITLILVSNKASLREILNVTCLVVYLVQFSFQSTFSHGSIKINNVQFNSDIYRGKKHVPIFTKVNKKISAS